jgi:hypothetical protein
MRLEPYSVAEATVEEAAAAVDDDGIDWVALGRGRHSVTKEDGEEEESI